MAVTLHTNPDLVADPPSYLFTGPYETEYDVASDGRFLVLHEVADEEARSIGFVLNALETLKK